ncbi:MAG: dihydrolipoamide succinyltransferase, partial [Phycisphaerales bacterium]|nr:dihydrolipoamide succinyltransferase [Phycisphaerales bacterium]
MPTDIVIPALGESITSGVIATWRKKDGDPVQRDETVLELETDKVTLELPSPAAGLLRHKAAEGDTVNVGSIVGLIEEGAAGAAKPAAPPATPDPPKPPPAPPPPPNPPPAPNPPPPPHPPAPPPPPP